MNNITFDDFKKLDIRIGKILSVEKVKNADNLLKLEVDFGPSPDSGFAKKQIVSRIAQWYEPEDLKGKKLPFIVNLEPRKFKGVESQGMLLAVDGKEKPILLEPMDYTEAGDRIV